MAFKAKTKVEGLSGLDADLRTLGKVSLARGVVVRALTTALQPMKATAKSLAPKYTGELKTGIDTGRKLTRSQRRKKPQRSDVEVYMGPDASTGQDASKAVVKEFGSVDQQATPYMRPAWDQHSREVPGAFAVEVRVEFNKVAARLARKNAREIARAKAGN